MFSLFIVFVFFFEVTPIPSRKVTKHSLMRCGTYSVQTLYQVLQEVELLLSFRSDIEWLVCGEYRLPSHSKDVFTLSCVRLLPQFLFNACYIFQQWEKRKVHKEATMPASQQHVIGAGPTSEELKTENANSHSQSARSEQLSERSLTQLELSRNQSGAHPSAAQAQYGYAFDEVEEDEEDDDARSAATGMSGPSKYAPSGYAPSSHHGGVTHDMMSQYEPSVYEADSTYDQSLYGRESEYGDEASSYSYNQDARSSGRGGYGHHARGRSGGHNSVSGRASVADTAAMSHLGSVMEMDDGGDSNSAYAPSDSYVSSYVSSEDDDGRPARSIHPRGGIEDGRSPSSGGYSSRHNTHRSGRENMSGGRSGFGASSAGGSSSRHSGGRSGFEGDSRDLDEDDDSVMHNIPVSMDDQEYYSEDNPSARGAPLTDVDERHNGQRW